MITHGRGNENNSEELFSILRNESTEPFHLVLEEEGAIFEMSSVGMNEKMYRRKNVDCLYEFTCPCGQSLVWAIQNAKVLCNRCDSWVEFKDLKNPNSYVIETDEPEQLSLF
jgi:hypothetical protein